MHSECNVMQERKTAQGIFSASNQFISKYVHIAQLSPAFLQDQPTKVPGAVTYCPECSSSVSWCGLRLGWSGERGQWLEGALVGLHSSATGPPANLAPFGKSLGLYHAHEGITWHFCFQQPPAQKVTARDGLCLQLGCREDASKGHTTCHQ